MAAPPGASANVKATDRKEVRRNLTGNKNKPQGWFNRHHVGCSLEISKKFTIEPVRSTP